MGSQDDRNVESLPGLLICFVCFSSDLGFLLAFVLLYVFLFGWVGVLNSVASALAHSMLGGGPWGSP